MRWLSGFAILFYLSLLCTPQAFALHDANVSPLADSQLQAVQPALQQHLPNQTNDQEDPHAAALIAAEQRFTLSLEQPIAAFSPNLESRNRYKTRQARAPPYFLTL
ncbi:hypothetical protein GCM10010919_15690 [Alishewanella longhuensis]|uniref:Uncharacterized protein n=1 Tax=Alishewanella longhuensis TaxID=1091037 RepID=A0ABQ3KXE1_9ALTE|nr:hypothetical protein [Alishewanella longhuensis]GHG67183.1 hypothetical protein GCM10010919_15690 [Alishewanella longhuensis]